jgi:hypothetical protein
MTPVRLGRIVSGGQTGVDRAALDFALAHEIPYGGWCPAGGWAEDVPRPPGVRALYPTLRETPGADPAQRTSWNVRDSDGTLILTRAGVSSPGRELTERAAISFGRPLAAVEALDPDAARDRLAALLAGLPAAPTVNVAGPRESEAPGIYAQALALLEALIPQEA